MDAVDKYAEKLTNSGPETIKRNGQLVAGRNSLTVRELRKCKLYSEVTPKSAVTPNLFLRVGLPQLLADLFQNGQAIYHA